jgi:hypothetical protein
MYYPCGVKPDTRTVKELFERDVRYVVPLYQRPYVWDAEHQWQPLWEDIEAVLEQRVHGGGGDSSHFLGAIVLEQELHSPGAIPLYTVIDGQQRLTTLQLLLGAASTVAAHAGADKEAGILNRLTKNDELTAEGLEVFKVWPTNANRAAFGAVMQEGGPPPDRDDDPNNRIDEAHAFFCSAIHEWLDDSAHELEQTEKIKILRVALSDLMKVVSITLEPDDNAQIIFETLNARGTPLLALDLVKNAVFHLAARQQLDIDGLYTTEWQTELDQPYWRQERRQGRLHRPRADLFLMHWLAMQLREVVPANELFTRFRQRILDAPEPPKADGLIRELRRDAQIMRSFENQPADSYEAVFFERLELLDTSVFMPLVLLLFRDPRISVETRRRALRILESWLVRRALMKLTLKNYNQQVPVMLARVSEEPENADEVLLDHLRSGVGEISRWPTDAELTAYLTTRPLYGNVATKRIAMALAAVEQSLYTSKVDIPSVPKSLSIEHIIPQSWEENWPLSQDGDRVELQTRREERIHRLGNLTLTAAPLNSALSNAKWSDKCHALNQESKLLLNVKLLADCPNAFDEAAVDERAKGLATAICVLWPGPESWAGAEAAPPVALADSFTISADQVLADSSTRPSDTEAGDDTMVHRYVQLLKLAVPTGAVDVEHTRGWGSRARFELSAATSVKYAYLDTDLPDEIPLRLYPADTLEQARVLYRDPSRCAALLDLRQDGWEVEPNFHFGFMTRGLSWSESSLPVYDYIAYWIRRGDDMAAIPREQWPAALEQLIADGIFAAADVDTFHRDFTRTERKAATPRPGLAVTRRWPLAALEDESFGAQLRVALGQALRALREDAALVHLEVDNGSHSG